jgi:hypothetical protein
MKAGDLVWVYHPDRTDRRTGIMISAPAHLYMVGQVARVLIGGEIMRIKAENIMIQQSTKMPIDEKTLNE